MSYQAIVKRGSELKRGGIGLVGAGVLAVVTACSAGLPPGPVVAPAPTVVPIQVNPVGSLLAVSTPTSAPQPGRARPLETFRYTPAPSETAPAQEAPRPLEIFRYTGQPRTGAPLTR